MTTGDGVVNGFRYEPTPSELDAAAMLREKGWTVDQPRCPECNGWGHRTLFKLSEDYVVGEGLTYMEPCSRGCAGANISWFLSQSMRSR